MTAAPVIDVERLVEMANQIGDFFAPYPPGQRTEGIRNHLRHYWDPRMREALLAHLDAGATGLSAHVIEAARTLRDPTRSSARAYAGPPKPS